MGKRSNSFAKAILILLFVCSVICITGAVSYIGYRITSYTLATRRSAKEFQDKHKLATDSLANLKILNDQKTNVDSKVFKGDGIWTFDSSSISATFPVYNSLGERMKEVETNLTQQGYTLTKASFEVNDPSDKDPRDRSRPSIDGVYQTYRKDSISFGFHYIFRTKFICLWNKTCLSDPSDPKNQASATHPPMQFDELSDAQLQNIEVLYDYYGIFN